MLFGGIFGHLGLMAENSQHLGLMVQQSLGQDSICRSGCGGCEKAVHPRAKVGGMCV